MAIKIYTKTGDAGNTSLLGGTKVPKSHIRIETYGTVDELNSYTGLVGDHLNEPDVKSFLKQIQDRLFIMGSSLACDPGKELQMKLPCIKEEDITAIEKWIDRMDETLPPMKNFILPGGHVAVSTTHVARCICRRTERLCVLMQEQQLYIDPLIIKYLNRLSDYFFVLARYIGRLLGIEEVIWKAPVG